MVYRAMEAWEGEEGRERERGINFYATGHKRPHFPTSTSDAWICGHPTGMRGVETKFASNSKIAASLLHPCAAFLLHPITPSNTQKKN